MNSDEIKKEIENLTNQVVELKRLVDEQKIILESHTHSGNDGSSYIYQDSLRQKIGQIYKTGDFAMTDISFDNVLVGAFSLGKDEIIQDGFKNIQIDIQHQPSTDGSTNQSFIYAFRGTAYSGLRGIIVSGGNTLQQKEFEFEPDSLVGHYINVDRDGTIKETYKILSNTKDTIIIDGTWTFTGSGVEYVIFMPVYLGSAQHPWRRVYVVDGTDGGIRFGVGATGGGQDGRLRMINDSLVWTSPGGTSTTLA